MKVWAIFISPLAGVVGVVLPFLLFLGINSNTDIESIKQVASMIGFIYFFALIIQISIVEIIMLSHDFLYTLKGYRCFAVFLSFCFAIPISKILETGIIPPFLFLLFYSIGNVLAYNQLFFKQLGE